MTPADQDPPVSERRSFTSVSEASALVVVAQAELRSTYPVSEILGRVVMNDAGERIGTIDDLMLDAGRVVLAILSVGGFLGLGSHQVVIAYADLLMDDDKLVLPGASRDALKEMTVYHAERAQAERPPLRRAHPGVRDAGQIVTTLGDEPISGIIADVTDGDPR